jgi:hypothetical protein
MRGLASEERRILLAPPHEEIHGLDHVFDRMAADGRIVVINRENDEFEWDESVPTDLGLLALRVCPPEDA